MYNPPPIGRNYPPTSCYAITSPREKKSLPNFSVEYFIFVKISKILINFQRAFERVSYNVREFDPIFQDFVQKSTL